jgi:hypothetical protein
MAAFINSECDAEKQIVSALAVPTTLPIIFLLGATEG